MLPSIFSKQNGKISMMKLKGIKSKEHQYREMKKIPIKDTLLNLEAPLPIYSRLASFHAKLSCILIVVGCIPNNHRSHLTRRG